MPKKPATTPERQAISARLPPDAVSILAALQEVYAEDGGRYSQSDVVVRLLREAGKREHIKGAK